MPEKKVLLSASGALFLLCAATAAQVDKPPAAKNPYEFVDTEPAKTKKPAGKKPEEKAKKWKPGPEWIAKHCPACPAEAVPTADGVPTPEGVPTPDAVPTAEGVPTPDAASSADATDTVTGNEDALVEVELPLEPEVGDEGDLPSAADMDAMKQKVGALRLLADGQLPGDLRIADLFIVDLREDAAVLGRITELKKIEPGLEAEIQRILQTSAEVAGEPADVTGAEPAPPVPDAGVDDAVTADVDAQDVLAQADVPTEPREPAEPVPGAGLENLSPEDGIRYEFLNLKLEALRLRLVILEKPLEVRTALYEAEQKRLLILAEQEAALEDKLAAEKKVEEAEAARKAALESAKTAETAAAKALAQERARVQAHRTKLAKMKIQLASTRQKHAGILAEFMDAERQLTILVHDEDMDQTKAAKAYDVLMPVYAASMARFREALDLLAEPSKVPEFELKINLDEKPYSGMGEERAKLLKAMAKADKETVEILGEEAEISLSYAEKTSRYASFFHGLSLDLIDKLPDDRRGSLLGLGREGFEQLGRELSYLGLMTRWYPRRLLESGQSIRKFLSDAAGLAVLFTTLVKLAALIAAAWYFFRRYRRWLESLRDLALDRVQKKKSWLALARFIGFVTPVVPSAAWIVVIYLALWIMDVSKGGLLDIAGDIALGFGWYRFCIALGHRYLVRATIKRKIDVTPELSGRIIRSMRYVGRLLFTVLVLLDVVEETMGPGYIYHAILWIVWIGAIPLVITLLQMWRGSIAASYLRNYPSGKFRVAVQKTQDRPVGLAVAGLAFGFVAVKGGWFYLRELLMRFEQTRRALAFLFRRKLEKHAVAVGRGSSDISVLPPELIKACSLKPADPDVAIDHWPYLDEIVERINAWKEDGRGTSFAVVGKSGVGKTTWLGELERRISGIEVRHLVFDRRLADANDVCRTISSNLADGKCAAGLDTIVQLLCDGPRRVVIIDRCQELMLRARDGTRAYEALTNVMARTTDRVIWVCSFTHYAWEYLKSLHVGRGLFRNVLVLKEWSEDDITRMIRKRMDVAGVEADFEDLVVEKQIEESEAAGEVLRTSHRFFRLLWDYTDGIPQVALHFWMRSLVPENEDRVRVRLFETPRDGILDDMVESYRFLLAAYTTHGKLSAEEAACVLRLPLHVCQALISSLAERGILEPCGGNRFEVTTHWNRGVTRFLRRKHLIFS